MRADKPVSSLGRLQNFYQCRLRQYNLIRSSLSTDVHGSSFGVSRRVCLLGKYCQMVFTVVLESSIITRVDCSSFSLHAIKDDIMLRRLIIPRHFLSSLRIQYYALLPLPLPIADVFQLCIVSQMVVKQLKISLCDCI